MNTTHQFISKELYNKYCRSQLNTDKLNYKAWQLHNKRPKRRQEGEITILHAKSLCCPNEKKIHKDDKKQRHKFTIMHFNDVFPQGQRAFNIYKSATHHLTTIHNTILISFSVHNTIHFQEIIFCPTKSSNSGEARMSTKQHQ